MINVVTFKGEDAVKNWVHLYLLNNSEKEAFLSTREEEGLDFFAKEHDRQLWFCAGL